MADVDQRFFCHQCSMEIPRVLADFTCPTCNSGFIELMEQGAGQPGRHRDEDHDDDSDNDEHFDIGQILGPVESLLPGLLGGGGPRAPLYPGGGPTAFRGPSQIRISRGPGPSRVGPVGPQNLGMDQAALENALQDFIFNLAGMQFGGPPGAGAGGGGGGGGGARFHFIGPGAGGGFQLHGNPGDYAWGRGGLDAIITQLLNQMDGAGPPPMTRENIQQIPTVKITKEMMEKSQSCSVCWEDFVEGEEVRLLECEHCFHEGCIVPWLELHGTCPVCRKELSSGASAGGGQQPHTASGPGEETEADTNTDSSFMSSSTSAPTTPGGSQAGGLSGIIQSALNQVFRSSNWSSQPQTGANVSENTSSSSAGSSNSQSQPSATSSSSSSVPTNDSNRPNNTGARAEQPTSDDDTPATRRQRLDSDFVDLDFD